MPRSLALIGVALGLLLVALGYVSALPWVQGVVSFAATGGPWCLLVGSMLSLVAIALLGAARNGRVPPILLAPLGLTFVLVTGGVGAALLTAPPVPGDPLWGGLPAGAAFVVYGAGLLPLFVIPLAYAWSFPHLGFESEELDELIRRARDRDPS